MTPSPAPPPDIVQRGLIEVDVLSIGSDLSEIVIVSKRLRQRLWVSTASLVLYDEPPGPPQHHTITPNSCSCCHTASEEATAR